MKMKKSIYLILTLSVIVLFNACSSVKVLDAWKADNANSIKDKNIIVIARTANKQARIAFENEIVTQLTSKGMTATASFTKFPNLKPDEEVTEDTNRKVKALLQKEGYNGVVLTVIKDIQESTKTVTDGGYYAGSNYSSYYPNYYGGFYGYYYHPMSYSSYGSYVPQTSTTFTSKTYVLETVAYNLDEAGEDQLVAVVTSKIEDPDDVTKTASQYVKAIVKSFEDK
jgi:hypothetical protein